MKHELELELIDELLALKAQNTHYLDEAVARNATAHYTDEARCAQEIERIHKRLPIIAAHISEVENAGDFVRRDLHGRPILITRDKTGQVNAFLNVCRHRGTRLVDDEAGCKKRFSCPYHGWTYANSGELIGAPHFDEGFPDESKDELGLKRVDIKIAFGFVWILPSAAPDFDFDAFFSEIAADLEAIGLEDMVIAGETRETRLANWKLIVEGGIEAYHFRVAHRKTIGPYFEDNLSSYRMLGAHMRSILPRTSMSKLDTDSRETWRLRDHANVLYNLFPATSLLVQQDHVVWINQLPVSAGQSELRLVTLVPKQSSNDAAYWQRNHEITTSTLAEDFDIGESIQAVAMSGANEDMVFGRFEGALDKFNQVVERYLRDNS